MSSARVQIVWTGVLTTVIGLAIKFTIGWRVSEEEEVDGIDFAEHGEAAYDLVGTGGGGLSSSILASSTAKEGVHA